MIVGLGTDCIAIARVAACHRRHPRRFLEWVFTGTEQNYCLRATDPAPHLAVRWAAIEATMKALGCGWADGVQFHHCEVLRHDNGRPQLVLHHRAKAIAEALAVTALHLSLSHADGMAIATVILEARG